MIRAAQRNHGHLRKSAQEVRKNENLKHLKSITYDFSEKIAHPVQFHDCHPAIVADMHSAPSFHQHKKQQSGKIGIRSGGHRGEDRTTRSSVAHWHKKRKAPAELKPSLHLMKNIPTTNVVLFLN
jgi:hypothetical protein